MAAYIHHWRDVGELHRVHYLRQYILIAGTASFDIKYENRVPQQFYGL